MKPYTLLTLGAAILALALLTGCPPEEGATGSGSASAAASARPTTAAPVTAASASAAASGSAAPGTADGEHDEEEHEPGTLGHWMEHNVKAAMGEGEFDKVRTLLKEVPGFAPDPSWNLGDTGWSTIVKAATAPDSNLGNACKSCHEAWQDKYKAEYPGRMISGG